MLYTAAVDIRSLVLPRVRPAADVRQPDPASSTLPQGQDPSKCHEGSDHEDQCREVDQAQVAERVEVVRIVSRKSHEEPDDRRSYRPHPGPELPSPHAVANEEQHGYAGRRDEPGQRDM